MYLFPCACGYVRDNIFCLFILYNTVNNYFMYFCVSHSVSPLIEPTNFSFVKVICSIILSNMINWDMLPNSLKNKQPMEKRFAIFLSGFGVTWQWTQRLKTDSFTAFESTTAFDCIKWKRNANTHDPSHTQTTNLPILWLFDWFRCGQWPLINLLETVSHLICREIAGHFRLDSCGRSTKT